MLKSPKYAQAPYFVHTSRADGVYLL